MEPSLICKDKDLTLAFIKGYFGKFNADSHTNVYVPSMDHLHAQLRSEVDKKIK